MPKKPAPGGRPTATHVTHEEGGRWIAWDDHKKLNRAPGLRVHSIRFEDDSVWDAYNGWRRGNGKPLNLSGRD